MGTMLDTLWRKSAHRITKKGKMGIQDKIWEAVNELHANNQYRKHIRQLEKKNSVSIQQHIQVR